MKKFFTIIFLLFFQQVLLYSAPALSWATFSENWLLLDFEYGGFFKNPIFPEATADNQFGSMGVGLTFQSYSNWRNWGLYMHPYFLFPAATVSTKNGGLTTTDERVDALFGLIIGPVYRIILGGGSYLIISAGLNVNYVGGSYTEVWDPLSGSFKYDLNGVNIGAGGEFGFRYDMSEAIHVGLGVRWVMDIFSTIYLTDPNRVPPNYLWMCVKPYVGIGITITAEQSWYIKFESERY
jgi:hypothetical protein